MAYVSTYKNVQVAAFNSPVGGNVPIAQPPGRNTGNVTNNNLPKAAKAFTCANKHPIAALYELHPNTNFEIICQYQTMKGTAVVVTTTLNDVVYQGEGTTLKIARQLAAYKALVGMNATDHDKLSNPVDFAEQKTLVMERISLWQEEQDKKAAKKAEQEKVMAEAGLKKAEKKKRAEEMANQPTIKKVKENSGGGKPVVPGFDSLMHKYGPNITDNIIQLEEKSSHGNPLFKCTLTVQGIVFEATGGSKKSARNEATSQAHAQFAHTPPPIVNEKTKRKKSERGEFKPIEPVQIQDKIAKKCWDFVTEQTASIPDIYKSRRNLVTIVKVEGEDSIDKCEVVAFGSGTMVIKKDNMTPAGTRINDSTGESLALRALRRYLLDQVERCLANKSSVYTKDRSGGKCSLKTNVQLYMYTNSAPMGDCRAYNSTVASIPMETNTTPVTPAPEPMETNQTPKKTKGRGREMVNVEDMGKIQLFAEGRDEQTELPGDKSLSILSPSDKLAVRQMCGVQGSILSSLSNPVYISKYLVDRAFNEEAMTRALHTRVKGAQVPPREVGPKPAFSGVMWKNSRNPENKSPWSFIWAQGHAVEIIHVKEGKQFHPKEGAAQPQPKELSDQLAESEYCTKALYTACSNVCRKFKKTYPQKYSLVKFATTRYRTIKNAVITHLKETGMGVCPESACKPDY